MKKTLALLLVSLLALPVLAQEEVETTTKAEAPSEPIYHLPASLSTRKFTNTLGISYDTLFLKFPGITFRTSTDQREWFGQQVSYSLLLQNRALPTERITLHAFRSLDFVPEQSNSLRELVSILQNARVLDDRDLPNLPNLRDEDFKMSRLELFRKHGYLLTLPDTEYLGKPRHHQIWLYTLRPDDVYPVVIAVEMETVNYGRVPPWQRINQVIRTLNLRIEDELIPENPDF